MYVAAYVLPAALVWAALGLMLRPLSGIPGLVPVAAAAYALGYGIVETAGLPVWRPTLAWQVPAPWIAGRREPVQALIWGATLGPGLVTRNPYAGMWLLPLLVALYHDPLVALGVGVCIGAAHGAARALGVLNNRKHLGARTAPLALMGWQWRWQVLDGVALLLAAGALTAYALALLGVRL